MKKTTTIICTSLALAFGITAFSGCFGDGGKVEKNEQQTVMNVSLNPKVEFVLDENDKVITVNALNEEGNLIISAEAFENVEGKPAEEAAKLFVQVSTETGYLVSGSASAGDNQISISLSGDSEQAEALYNDVKAKMNEYFTAENITAKIDQAAAITEAQLQALIEECAPYLETAEMEYKELVKTLAEQRKETAEYYSQELKNAYYEAKEFAMQQAELETLKTHLSAVQQLVFDGLSTAYELAVEMIETTRMELLVNEDSIYQKALAAFRQVKAEYLKARNEFSIGGANVTVELTEEELAALKTRVEEAETALLNAGVKANESLDTLKDKVKESYDKAIAKLQEYNVKANEYVEEVSAEQKKKQTEFFTAFETKYAEAKQAAEKNWNDMQTELENSEEVAE